MVKKFNFEESLRQNGKEEKEGNKVRKIYGSSSEEGLFLNATLGYVAGSPSIVLFLCVLTDDIFALSTTALPCPRSRTDSSILRRSGPFFLEFFQNSFGHRRDMYTSQ